MGWRGFVSREGRSFKIKGLYGRHPAAHSGDRRSVQATSLDSRHQTPVSENAQGTDNSWRTHVGKAVATGTQGFTKKQPVIHEVNKDTNHAIPENITNSNPGRVCLSLQDKEEAG
jgi:hypothetical protein